MRRRVEREGKRGEERRENNLIRRRSEKDKERNNRVEYKK